jgi:hypothetical protein
MLVFLGFTIGSLFNFLNLWFIYSLANLRIIEFYGGIINLISYYVVPSLIYVQLYGVLNFI